MKINATSSVYSVETYRAQATRTAKAAGVRTEQDKVDLSTDAMSFADAFSAVKSSIETQISQRPASVDAIKVQYEQGTYTVDSEDLASSILLFT